jgi:SPP1 gp7 family putative phage head morphogenesis protein
MPIIVNPDQFIVHTHGMECENRYGTAECAEVFWIWFLITNMMRWWGVFAERFGQPTLIGEYKRGTSKPDQDLLLEALETIQTEYGVIIPETAKISLLEAQRYGTVNTYLQFIEWAHRCMSEAITGQSLATGQGTMGTGSYGQSQTHADVKQEYVESDAKELMGTLNGQLVAPLVRWNFGAECPCPSLKIDYESKNLNADLDLDAKLVNELGLDLGEDYIYKKYERPKPVEGEPVVKGRRGSAAGSGAGVMDDGEDVEEADDVDDEDGEDKPNAKTLRAKDAKKAKTQWGKGTEKNAGCCGKVSRHGASKRERTGKRDVGMRDRYADAMVKEAGKVYGGLGAKIGKLVQGANEFGEVRDGLKEMRANGDFKQELGAVLYKAKLNCYLLGAAQVMRESGARKESAKPEANASKKKAEPGVTISPEPLPPDDAIVWFEELTPLTKEELGELADEARSKAFTVSDVEEKETLEEIQDSLAEAMANGETFEDWKEEYNDIRSEAGLDEADGWRAEQVFRDETHRAYGAGRARSLKDDVVQRNLWGYEYVAIMDDRVRPEHASLNGFKAPVDDPFWNDKFPPWDYGCRCVAVPITKFAGEREGVEASGTVTMPDGTEVDPRQWKANKKYRGLGL